MSTETQGPDLSGDELQGDRVTDRRVRRVLFACASITVLTTIALFLVLFDNAAGYFYGARIWEVLIGEESFRQTVSFSEFFSGTRWAPVRAPPAHGALPIIWGTIAITVGAAFVSIPIGTATALYLSEYAKPKTRNRLKPILEVLAGIPTIVYGFFAVSFVTPIFVSTVGSLFGISVGRYSMMAGWIVVGTMTIPMVSSISEDAMQAVPDDLRDGAYALGATKYQVSLRIVLPAALSGILASYILAISRAIGETMAVSLAAGFQPQLTANPFDEIMTMTAYMVSLARGTTAVGSVEYQSLFAVGLILFIMTLAANLFNDYLKRRFQEVYR